MQKLYEYANEKLKKSKGNNLEELDNITEWCHLRNGNIPKDIIYYSFARHITQLSFLAEFKHIDFEKITLQLREFETKELMNFNYSDFTTLKEEFDFVDNPIFKGYYEKNFINGTFEYPILVIENRAKYKIIDGNNRYRFFRSIVKYHPEILKKYYNVYVLSSE